jgi:hypothetical protein
VALVALMLLALGACGEGRPPVRHLPDGSRLVQKGPYQALYGPTGRLERVLRDDNGDGTADAIVLYGEGGQAQRVELDTNGDHVIDRRERLRPDGTVAPGEDANIKADRTGYADR